MKTIRQTSYRKALLHLFSEHTTAFGLKEIRQSLDRAGFSPHRSTLYRELKYLIKEGLLEEIVRGKTHSYKGKKQSSVHYHHAVCELCHLVLDIEIPTVEVALKEVERTLAREALFESLGHTLAVFGLCASCKQGKV